MSSQGATDEGDTPTGGSSLPQVAALACGSGTASDAKRLLLGDDTSFPDMMFHPF